MEAGSQAPTKRQRSSSINQLSSSLAVVECIREFKLPQTFPSMVKYAKAESNMTVQNVKQLINKSFNVIQTNISNKDTQVPPKLQKLKLKSPDGRDLGEFDVQILPQNNNNNKNNTAVASLNLQSKANDSSSSGTILDDKNSRKFIQISSGVKNSTPPLGYLSKPLKFKVPERTQGVLIPISSNMIANSSIENNQSSMTIDNQQKNKMFIVQPSKNNWQVMKNTQSINSLPVMIKSRANEDEAKLEGLEAVSHEIKKNNKPVVTHKDDGGIFYTGIKRKMDGTFLKAAVSKDKKFVNVGNSNIVMKLEGIEENNSGENMVFVVPNDSDRSENDIFNNSGVVENKRQFLRNSHGTVNLIRRGRKDNLFNRPRHSTDNHMFLNDSNSNSNDALLNNNSFNDNTLDDDLSSNLSIVGHALSTIGDEELKAKALKALADCGIGFERFVPVKPPPDKMSIKESQSQTHVFGLLDKKDFIKVTGETEGLERLQEIERDVDCTKIPKEVSAEALKFSRELNKMLDSFWVNKNNLEQMREILKVNPLVEKAYHLLEKDFKNCKKHDKNGLLNIHKAVLSNQARSLKRQIMVLKNCKESIDLCTSDGQTSLELAVRHNASLEIINMLLKAGASPTASESAHDSALTIASKQSSSILLKLIPYLSVTDPAINNVDSEGYTALHYCAMYGNEEGVDELIRVNVDLNARDCKSGRTALFHALESEYIQISKNLLAHGAKGNIPNFAGQTVFTLFDEDKHYVLKDALQKSMK